jgi:hypothetical protein
MNRFSWDMIGHVKSIERGGLAYSGDPFGTKWLHGPVDELGRYTLTLHWHDEHDMMIPW